MKKHKLNIFPEANASDFASLYEDIRANGYDPKLPITIYHGEIIDGWNRQMACDKLGVTPVYVEFEGNDDDALAFIMRTNSRRNLTESQRAMIAAKWAGLKRGGSGGSHSDSPIGGTLPTATATRNEAAAMLDVGTSSIDRAKKIIKEAPELVEKVERGEISVNAAYVTTQKAKREDDEPIPEPEPLVVDGVKPKREQWIPDDAARLWLLAKTDLEKILPNDKSRLRILQEVISYAQSRIDKNK